MGRTFDLQALARHVDARLIGDPGLLITGISSLETARAGELSHLSSPAYRPLVTTTRAAALIISERDLPLWDGNALVVSNPYHAFARLSQLFAAPRELGAGAGGPACVDATATLAADVQLAPGVVIGPRVEVGRGTRLHANVVVGADCVVGEDVEVFAGAVLYDDVHLGDRCVVHAAAVLGADGFGFAPGADGTLEAIAQLGGVRIGANVSIGAATTVDRGALDHTVIEDGVKIDNQVQIGHNCHIGAHSVICGCVGIVGSTTIGRHCVLAGGVGIGGDGPLSICDRVTVSGMTHVSSSIDEPGIYSGGVIHSRSTAWKRNALRLLRLDELFRRVGRLEKRAHGDSER